MVNPTTRVAAACLYVLAEVTLYPGGGELLLGWVLLLAVMIAVYRARVSALLVRTLPALPFLLAVAVFLPFSRPGATWWEGAVGPWTVTVTRPGLEACGIVLSRSALAILAMVMVAATTTPGEACHALQELRVPALLVLVIALGLRYLAVIRAEMGALLCARDLRRCGRPAPGEWREPGHLAGTLLVRTIERAERVHGAMLLRGFDGRFRLLRSVPSSGSDFAFLGAVTTACVGLGILARW